MKPRMRMSLELMLEQQPLDEEMARRTARRDEEDGVKELDGEWHDERPHEGGGREDDE